MLTTVIAAAAQTARNATQTSLTGTLGTLGATQVRFVYGFPFALVFLAIVATAAGEGLPAPSAEFFGFTAAGAVAQICGTALLLASMRDRSFSVATAFSKTEAVQVALFGLLILGDHLTLTRAAAIAIATGGVVLTAVKPGEKWAAPSLRPVLFGVASGGFFAAAAVGFRGGILALQDGAYFLRATTTLAWSLGIQALLLGGWLAIFARSALLGSLNLWRQSLFAGFLGAFASQFWFLGLSLTAAANVRTLGLVEVLFAQAVSRRLFGQRVTAREAIGMAALVGGIALLLGSEL
jgi:drug/metabolite transporter (DMT)-like permease